MNHDLQHEALMGAVRASPPVAVTGLQLGGVGLSDWLILLTIVYTVLQIGFLVYDRIKKNSKGPADECPREPE